ncbi:hypothetical protein PoB_007560500 [Plakobranchus ocellatus]|uniref:Uncharacterized protein n=1 Tax=Plakobranchus ocellatus TaxID=259542 RepID=A0AAV4DYK6_9GAST|nr:hypothetical protein PoB_007560500 [Plakobranchus ocellatus]
MLISLTCLRLRIKNRSKVDRFRQGGGSRIEAKSIGSDKVEDQESKQSRSVQTRWRIKNRSKVDRFRQGGGSRIEAKSIGSDKVDPELVDSIWFKAMCGYSEIDVDDSSKSE